MKICFFNINDNARHKIDHNHPYMNQIIYKHNANILVFIDTRLVNKPNWNLQGYTLIAHKASMIGDSKNNIGGILIYKKHNASNNSI